MRKYGFVRQKSENKYKNHKIENSFGVFDSMIEYKRFLFLQDAYKNGKIRGLRRQVEYLLIPRQTEQIEVVLKTKTKIVERVVERECSYKADFVYEKDGNTVVEDVKGSLSIVTQDALIKKKLMLYNYGIKVKYVTKPTEEI